jgi:hypothetical protein
MARTNWNRRFFQAHVVRSSRYYAAPACAPRDAERVNARARALRAEGAKVIAIPV